MQSMYLQLLVGLVSAYRYEGSRVDEDIAKSEAKALGHAIKNAGTKDPVENYEVIRILTTRSKTHLIETFRHYSGIHGKSIEQVHCCSKTSQVFAVHLAM